MRWRLCLYVYVHGTTGLSLCIVAECKGCGHGAWRLNRLVLQPMCNMRITCLRNMSQTACAMCDKEKSAKYRMLIFESYKKPLIISLTGLAVVGADCVTCSAWSREVGLASPGSPRNGLSSSIAAKGYLHNGPWRSLVNGAP